MDSNDHTPDILQGIAGAAKHLISRVPGLGEAVAGWDSYNRNRFERNVKRVIEYLHEKLDNPDAIFSDDWVNSEEGQQFCRKVFDSAFDAQMEDKQELFVNALINGIRDQETSDLEKLRFVDILRHLSRASLVILAEMHLMFKDDVRGPGRSYDSLKSIPLVDPNKVAEWLSDKHHPYSVSSAIHEMEGQGLFSNIGEWRKLPGGSYAPGAGFSEALSYTDFTYRFVEFITIENRE